MGVGRWGLYVCVCVGVCMQVGSKAGWVGGVGFVFV